MTAAENVIFLVDCDNTLLDNDQVQVDLREHLATEFGTKSRDRYWAIFEELRRECGYADYLGALQRYRIGERGDSRLLLMSSFLINYPFARRLYPEALAVLHHLHTQGLTVILSDGDVVFQPRKIQRSGLWAAVDGRVLVCVHKEQMLDDVAAQFPGGHYVVIDDKLRILSAVKDHWHDRVTTVFPRQGHYAHDTHEVAAYPAADVTVERIGELLVHDFRGRA